MSIREERLQKMKESLSQNNNSTGISIYAAIISMLGFAGFFIAFLFTLNVMYGLISFAFVLAIFVALIVILKQGSSEEIRALISYHKMRQELIRERNILQAEFLKQNLNETHFKSELDKLDAQILDIDFKISSFDTKNVTKEQEIDEKIALLHKKYMKREISEELYTKLVFDLKKQQAYANAKLDESH